MKTISQDFIQAVNVKDYSKVENLLKFMAYEREWVGNNLMLNFTGVTFRTEYIKEEAWNFQGYELVEESVPIDNHYTKTFYIYDWTPLTIAALSLDETTLNLVLERWNNSSDLLLRSYKTLERAEKALDDISSYLPVKNRTHTSTNKTYSFERNTIVHAKNLLRQRMAQNQITYSFSDNDNWHQFIAGKIAAIKSIEELITFYDNNVSFGVTPFVNIYSFFTTLETTAYSKHSINLVSLIQERAHQLISQQEGDALFDSCGKLLISDLFSIKHYQYGIENRELRELIVELNSQNPNLKNTQGAPVATVIGEETQSNAGSLLDSIYYLLNQLSEIPMNVINFFEQILTLIVNAFSSKEERYQTDMAMPLM
tara:strand:- start:440 stop:1546 length:1107 start_codon:yes stop_codon:yes gene_type:complete